MGYLVARRLVINMNSLIVLSSLVACSLSAPTSEPIKPKIAVTPAQPYINTGAASGPAHLALGDLVATANGYRSLALEGFSEDVNQDGFVDPIAPAVPVAPVVTYAHPYALHPYGFLWSSFDPCCCPC